MGFSVWRVQDADEQVFEHEIREHLRRIARTSARDQASASFFYFSGHGAVADDGGTNYLIPIDSSITKREEFLVARSRAIPDGV